MATMRALLQSFFAALLAQQANGLNNGLGLTPPMAWSSWNAFAQNFSEVSIRQQADAIIAHGLNKLGYTSVNIDCGWSLPARDNNGTLQPNPAVFPSGLQSTIDYIHSLGLKVGIYSEHYTTDCCGGPGMFGYQTHDAQTFAAWGVDYLKVDSCAGHALPPEEQWQNYLSIAQALNATGRPIYVSICPTSPNPPGIDIECLPWEEGNLTYSGWMWTNGVNSSWADPGTHLANSMLVEFCNNANGFETTTSIVDAQAALVSDPAYSRPGAWLDMDMLTVGCSDQAWPNTPCGWGGPALSLVEQKSQFSLWSILASPLILGSDLRFLTNDTLSIITNTEVIAVNQDPLGYRARLVADVGSRDGDTSATLHVAPCNASDPTQTWVPQADGSVQTLPGPAGALCLDAWDCGVQPGTRADAYSCHVSTPACGDPNGSPNQQWSLALVPSSVDSTRAAQEDATRQTTTSGGSSMNVTIRSQLALPGFPLCVDLQQSGQGTAGVYAVVLNNCTEGVTSQVWSLTGTAGVHAHAPVSARDSPQVLVNAQTNTCLTTTAPARTQVYAKKLVDGSRAVALFNRGPSAVPMTVTWAQLLLGDPGQPWQFADVRDLWAHQTVGTHVQGGYTTTVESHAVTMLLVTASSA